MEPQDFVWLWAVVVCHCCPGSGLLSGFREDKVHIVFPTSPSLGGSVEVDTAKQLIPQFKYLFFMFPFSKFHSSLWSSLGQPLVDSRYIPLESALGKKAKNSGKSQNVDNNVPIAMEHSAASLMGGCCENQLMFVKAFGVFGGKVPPECYIIVKGLCAQIQYQEPGYY